MCVKQLNSAECGKLLCYILWVPKIWVCNSCTGWGYTCRSLKLELTYSVADSELTWFLRVLIVAYMYGTMNSINESDIL